MRRAEAVNGDTQASDNRSHQRELARGKQRTAGLPVGWERRKIDRAFVHYKILQGVKFVDAWASTLSGEHGDFRLTARWRRN
jgi:hypothetical protein